MTYQFVSDWYKPDLASCWAPKPSVHKQANKPVLSLNMNFQSVYSNLYLHINVPYLTLNNFHISTHSYQEMTRLIDVNLK